MKNILSIKLFVLLCGFFVLSVTEKAYAFSPEGVPSEEPIEYIEEVLKIGSATITVRKEGYGISSTVNNVSYGATVYTNRGSFTSSLNPSSNEVVYNAEAATYTVTGISASPNSAIISIFGCAEKPSGVDLRVIGAKFTLQDGHNYLLVMTFTKPN